MMDDQQLRDLLLAAHYVLSSACYALELALARLESVSLPPAMAGNGQGAAVAVETLPCTIPWDTGTLRDLLDRYGQPAQSPEGGSQDDGPLH